MQQGLLEAPNETRGIEELGKSVRMTKADRRMA